MIDFYILTEDVSDNFKKIYNFYFKKFVFKIIFLGEQIKNRDILFKSHLGK